MKIAVDCMGSDGGPNVIVKGAISGMRRYNDLELVLVGDKDEVKSALNALEYDKDRVSIYHTSEVITNEDQPVVAIRAKKDSSMVVSARMVKDKDVDAYLTAGSTGSYLASGLLLIGRLRSIRRPALSAIIPSYDSSTKESLLLDCGANMDASADDLYNYALMGSLYAELLMDRHNPKISLLNVGTESGKGNKTVKEAYDKIESSNKLNFAGNIEARTVFMGQTDVVICDGFSGNVAIKTFEGAAKALMGKLKETLFGSIKSKVGALLLKDGLNNMRQELDYNQYGGGVLLGLKGIAVKCHGSANELAVEVAVGQTYKMIEKQIVPKIEKQLERIVKEN